MRKIGIICAVDRELAPFLSRIENCSVSEKAMLKFYSGSIEGVPIVTLFCGECKTNAALATQILIDFFGCTDIINAGTAGGMDKDIRLLDTIISTECAYWDVHEEILVEFHPRMENIYFKADDDLIKLAKIATEKNAISTKVVFGRMLTGEAFIEDNFRDEINTKFSPLCVDMETAGIAHVCYVNKIPYIAVRTITDTAEHIGSANFEQNCARASAISADIVTAMLKAMSTHPNNLER